MSIREIRKNSRGNPVSGIPASCNSLWWEKFVKRFFEWKSKRWWKWLELESV